MPDSGNGNTTATGTDCWQPGPPSQHQQSLSANRSQQSSRLCHIAPTRVKRVRQPHSLALQLPPFQQPALPRSAAHAPTANPHLTPPALTSPPALFTPTAPKHPSHPTTHHPHIIIHKQPGSHPHRPINAHMATTPAVTPTPGAPYSPSAGSLLLGARVVVTSQLGTRHGKVVDVQSTGKHKILFDAGVCEWLSLPAHSGQWAWLTPRALSAGLTPALCAALRKLGCTNVYAEPQSPTTAPPGVIPGPAPSSAEAAIGRQLWLWCPGSGRWHEAVVVALSRAGTGAHYVVYMDGAAEWVMLDRETVVWRREGGPDQRVRHIYPPNITGVPAGEDAVNWRVALFWPDDQTFFEGTVTEYKAETGEHEIIYDDGQEEDEVLDHQELVIWRCKIRDVADVKLTGAITRRANDTQGNANKRPRVASGAKKPGAVTNSTAPR